MLPEVKPKGRFCIDFYRDKVFLQPRVWLQKLVIKKNGTSTMASFQSYINLLYCLSMLLRALLLSAVTRCQYQKYMEQLFFMGYTCSYLG